MLRNRLIQFIKSQHLTVSKFEQIVGLSNGAVSRTNEKIRQRTITSISDKFPSLNIEWLLTGEGEMCLVENEPVHKQEMDSGLIPFYDAETTGGYSGRVSSSTEDVSIKGYIEAGGWFNGRETAAIRHIGDSMKEYPDGCILAVRAITDKRLLVYGRNYVIETSEYRITKRIQRGSSPNKIALYSSNEERYADGRLIHEPFEIDVEDIVRIFSIIGYIVNQFGEFRLVKA